eukprot:gene37835-49575_t
MYAPDPNTSSYSVANIGCSPGPRKHDAAKQHFQTEGGQFPETANKLHESFRTNNSDNFLSSKTNTLASTRVATSKFSPVNIGLNEDERHVPLRAHYKTEAATVQQKLQQSLTGRTPMPKDFLYPQNASHQQILTLTGSVMMPSPFKDPPQVSRPKKWLGNDVGWEER